MLRRAYSEIAHGLHLLGKGLEEKVKRAKTTMAKMLGDREAREKLELIDRFKRETGVKYVGPDIYEYNRENIEFLLNAWRKRVALMKDIESALEERGIVLDPEQEEMLEKIKKAALRDPRTAEAVAISASYLHDNRGAVAWAAPLLREKVKSRWDRYLLWKILGPLRPEDIKRFVEGYKEARKGKMPFFGAGKYFALYDDPEKLSMYRKIVDLIGGKKFVPTALHPSIRTAHEDPQKGAKLAELMAAVGEVVKGHNNLREIIEEGYKAHTGTDDREGASKAFEVVLEKLRERFGTDVHDLPLEGRYAERVNKVYELRNAWADILKKYQIKDILDKLRSDKITGEEREKLEKEYQRSLRLAAEEFVRLLEGDDMLRKWFSRIKERIRSMFGGSMERPVEERAKMLKENVLPEGAEKGGETAGILEKLAADKEKEEKRETGALHLEEIIRKAYSEARADLPEHLRAEYKGYVAENMISYMVHNNLLEKGYAGPGYVYVHPADEKAMEEIMKELKRILKAHITYTETKYAGYKDLREIIREVAKRHGKRENYIDECAKLLKRYYSQKVNLKKELEKIRKELTDHEKAYHSMIEEVATKISEILAARAQEDQTKIAEVFKAFASTAAENKNAHDYLLNIINQHGKYLNVNELKIDNERTLKDYLDAIKELENKIKRMEKKAQNTESKIKELHEKIKEIEKDEKVHKITHEALRVYQEQRAKELGEKIAAVLEKHLREGKVLLRREA